jgi:hypothetical protein
MKPSLETQIMIYTNFNLSHGVYIFLVTAWRDIIRHVFSGGVEKEGRAGNESSHAERGRITPLTFSFTLTIPYSYLCGC